MSEKKRHGALKKVLAAALILISAAMIAAGIYVWGIARERIDLSLFTIDGMGTPSRVYVMDEGEWVEWSEEKILGVGYFEPTELEDVPENLSNAFIAIEDKRFMSHRGVDVARTLGAALNYFLHFKGSYGGSTITQQLIKNVTGNGEVSIERKIKEISFALQLERKMSKEEILELYLNIINLSEGCYGVGSAARRYFSKSVGELTLTECAAIAAITNNPSYYNPINHPEHNRERRELILREMYAQGMISREELDGSLGEELSLSPDDTVIGESTHSWYVDMVINDVIDDLTEERGMSREGASRLVFGGGLNIYIQIDRDIQKIIDDYYTDGSNFISEDGAQSAMIIIDPESGDILGVAGAVGEKTGNRIQSFATDTLRPPGSVIKPLSVYAPALERGIITYASVYDDVPYNFTKNASGTLSPWPKNANATYHGLSDMSYCISNSTNTVPLFILDELGLSHSFYFLRDYLGLSDLVERGRDKDGNFITDMNYAALALGQLNYGISVRDVTAAYSIFADGGTYHSPRSYSRVESSAGEILLRRGIESRSVISEGNAEIMTKLLSEVAQSGTASALTVKNKVALACKTGTSQDNKDRWCVGYTPSLICGVWYGYEYPREIPRAEKNHFLSAFDSVLTTIYESDVRSAYKDRKFGESGDVIALNYCADSGLLPTESCLCDARGSRSRLGYFVRGTEPTEHCATHVSVEYDAVCGGVATVFTPKNHIKQVGMISVEREFPIQVTVGDAQYVYREPENGRLPSFSDSEALFYSCDEERKKYYGVSTAHSCFNRLSTAHFTLSDLVFCTDLLENQH